MLQVVKPGLLTTVQDDGRWGYQRFGVPVAGPMDPGAHRLANVLVGNRQSAATLEITLVGPVLEFKDEALFAVTGARFELCIDGATVELDTSYTAQRGQRLVFGDRSEGARAYMAIAGGFDLPMVLGSRATDLTSAMGGLRGRPLLPGDELPVGVDRERNVPAGVRRANVISLPQGGARIRVLAGPHHADFGPAGLLKFLDARYVVSTQSNRMGYRLTGEPLSSSVVEERLSTATPMGSVQVPTGGQPIILMADHQTTGGYSRIATVITADFGVAGQLAPGDWVEFELCDRTTAIKELIEHERFVAS